MARRSKKSRLIRKAGSGLLAALATGGVAAQSAPQQIEVTGHYDNAIGTSDAASQGTITAKLLESRPALRPGEVLEFVPGVIVTQHSGDGKANQYFLRGFNLDHGTDFATAVNGIPVNMPTHGHGQGYSDLNFLMPELVQRIEYRKGPYFASGGDFASAGSADIVFKRSFDAPFAQVSFGDNGYRRGVAGGSGDVGGGITLLGAVELMTNDGPWTVPENLRRSNGVFSASGGTADSGWSASLMGYSACWDSTDQVPQRLIDAGSYSGKPFGRFDAVDPTDGGETARTSLSGEWHHQGEAGLTKVSAFAMHYRLKLFSNFTFFLDNPVDGDQFSQQDDRNVFGLRASHAFSHQLFGLPVRSEVGLQLRHDRIHVGLFDTVARVVTNTTRNDEVGETLAGVYGQSVIEFMPTLRAIVGVRSDTLRNNVDSNLAANSGRANASQLSPKLTLIAGPFAKTEFFANAGRGFHSNDARGTTATVDPKNPDPATNHVDKVPPLVASEGYEIGARTELIPGLQTSIALWKLNFKSELVYVGDAGATEASDASRRHGLEWNNRWVPVPWFLLDADLAWTRARFANGDHIPNSVDKVASIAATVRDVGPWSASLQWRYLGSGALIEDNSVRSKPAITTNLRLAYHVSPQIQTTLDVFNLLDRKVDDIQYYYASRLPGEPVDGVPDIHLHPAEPRALRLTVRVAF